MSANSLAQAQLEKLKTKLDQAIASRSELEEDFNKRSSMLVEFIAKLSNACKGLDLELDNRLAKLRALLKKSSSIDQIDSEIEYISKLLTKQASKNEKNIRNMHVEFHQAGSILQQAKGVPPLLRRNLRELLNDNEDSKDALIQYIPKLSELLTIYAQVLEAKNDIDAGKPGKISNGTVNSDIDIRQFSKRILTILTGLKLSKKQQEKLEKVKASVAQKTQLDDQLLNDIAEIFNIVAADMEQERRTAKTFLSTLSGALLKLQRTIKSSINSTNEQQKLQSHINNNITKQLGEMIEVVDGASSLGEVKAELHTKINIISKEMEIKSLEELEYYQDVHKQLIASQVRVQELEQQSKRFEKRLIEQQLKSMQDALTKLNNRAAFDEHIAKTMVRFHHKAFDLGLAIIDLDDFKSINDTYGHTAGDKTLQVIAKTLSKVLEDSAFIARYGGEEFVLVFEGLSYGDLMVALDNLRAKIAQLPFKFRNTKVNITTSIGVTHVKAGDNIHQAFERADQALYNAKNTGKNQVIYAE